MKAPVHQGRSGGKRTPPAGKAPKIRLDYEAILNRFEAPLLRYVGQLIGPGREASEEVVQETFLRLHRQIERHGAESIDNLPSWLFRVAHNLAISTLRRRDLERKLREQAVRDRTDEGEGTTPLDEMVRREVCDRIMAELHTLPQEQKQVLLLKMIQGFSFREIGEITGLAVSNVAYRINQGLRELSRRLKNADLM